MHGHDIDQAAIVEAALFVVLEADQTLTFDGKPVRVALQLADPAVIGVARFVLADQYLIGVEDHLRVHVALGDDRALAILPVFQRAARADRRRQMDDRIALGLPVDLRQHHVRLGVGEIPATLDRRKLRRIAQHKDGLAVGHQILTQILVHHRAFVDHDQRGLLDRVAFALVEIELQFPRLEIALHLVDLRVNRAGAIATAVPHDHRSLARKGGILRRSLDLVREVACQCRLARAGEPEHPMDLLVARLEPSRDRLQSLFLLRRPHHHGCPLT